VKVIPDIRIEFTGFHRILEMWRPRDDGLSGDVSPFRAREAPASSTTIRGELSARQHDERWGCINEPMVRLKQRTMRKFEGINNVIPESQISPMFLSRSTARNVSQRAPRGKIGMI
jgi:hypothetical protein